MMQLEKKKSDAVLDAVGDRTHHKPDRWQGRAQTRRRGSVQAWLDRKINNRLLKINFGDIEDEGGVGGGGNVRGWPKRQRRRLFRLDCSSRSTLMEGGNELH